MTREGVASTAPDPVAVLKSSDAGGLSGGNDAAEACGRSFGSGSVVPRKGRLNLASIGLLVVVVWLTDDALRGRTPAPNEALVWRYLRALADHPVRTSLAALLLAHALGARRALWREP